MIIACPACHTRYVVPDSAIGVDGRTVRCAKCKHSWFQDGPEPEAVMAAHAAAEAAVTAPADHANPQPVNAPPMAGATTAGAAASGENIAERVGSDFAAPTTAQDTAPTGSPYRDPPLPPVTDEDDGFSRFDAEPPFKPRRNVMKLWTWAAGIFALVAAGAILLISTAGVPEWVPINRPLFGAAPSDLAISFPVEEQDRRTLPNGTEFFGAKITVSNDARESRKVPPILIVLRDQRERKVFSWVVTPPKSTIGPGETLTINEAVTDVPKSAVFADIGWAPR